MLKISQFTFNELLLLYDNCSMHLANEKLTVPQRQEILQDQAEIYYAMELKIPDSHINQIVDMKRTMQERELAKMKYQQRYDRRERNKDVAITMGLTLAIVATVVLMMNFAPEINAAFNMIVEWLRK